MPHQEGSHHPEDSEQQERLEGLKLITGAKAINTGFWTDLTHFFDEVEKKYGKKYETLTLGNCMSLPQQWIFGLLIVNNKGGPSL